MEMRYDAQCGKVGYAYVPEQKLGQMYTLEEGFCEGTIFPELNIPMPEYSPAAE